MLATLRERIYLDNFEPMDHHRRPSPDQFRSRSQNDRKDAKLSDILAPLPQPVEVGSADKHLNLSVRQRGDSERITLPSIHQIVPNIPTLSRTPEVSARTPPASASPTVGHAGVATPPEYVYSSDSQKRRRFSLDGDTEERASRIPRLYASSHPDHPQRQPGPTSQPSTGNWNDPPRSDPFLPHRATGAGWDDAMRMERGPALSGLSPHLPSPRPRPHASDDSVSGYPTRLTFPPERAESSPVTFPQNSGYTAYHPMPGTPPYPPPSCGYAGHYADCMCNRGGVVMGLNGGGKARKRRGNLPKETTDVLRRWFIAHLHHPYPTEEEKQALMKQTHLQINQISNWFINARRRQMPILGASPTKGGARSRQSTDGKRLDSRERSIKSIDKGSSTSSSDEETTTPTSSSVLSYRF